VVEGLAAQRAHSPEAERIEQRAALQELLRERVVSDVVVVRIRRDVCGTTKVVECDPSGDEEHATRDRRFSARGAES
jgi:hypothetical protein